MPVYAYEIDDGNPEAAPALSSTEPTGSGHVSAWYLPFGYDQPSSLDPNDQVLFNEELSRTVAFARDGSPTGQGTIPWPQFKTSDNILVLSPSDDSQPISESQDSADHHCGFWNRVARRNHDQAAHATHSESRHR